jgi:hypothetical protein
MKKFSSFIGRRRLFERSDGRIEEVIRDELREISRENEAKLERMKRDVMKWAEGGREFEVVERNFLADPESIGNCITVGDKGDVMSYDEFVDEFLDELFTCIEEICVYYPLEMSRGRGRYSVEVEFDLSEEDVRSMADVREVIRERVPGFDYKMRGNRLRVDFRTYFFKAGFGPEREWIAIERL